MEKIDFQKYCPLILISFIKCGLYCLYMVFWSFFGTMVHDMYQEMYNRSDTMKPKLFDDTRLSLLSFAETANRADN